MFRSACIASFAVALTAAIPSVEAWAQVKPPVKGGPATPPKPGSPAGQPPPDSVKKATEAFKQGTSLFGAKRYALALEQFKKSYDIVPSPNSGLYVARCHVEMGQNREAFAQFKKVIAEAEARAKTEPKYIPTRDSAKGEMDELLAKIATITVNVSGGIEGSSLKVGGVIVPKEEWGTLLPVEPGPVEVILETPGKQPTIQRLEVKKGARETANIAPPADTAVVAPPPPPPPETSDGPSAMLPLAITFGGIGIIGMGMFGVAGAMSLSTYSELEDACPTGTCPPSQNETIDRGQREQLIANIGVIVGGVGLAAGATFLIIELATGGGGGDASTKEAAAVDVDVDVGPGYVGVSGKF
jgi:hypothetical protein